MAGTQNGRPGGDGRLLGWLTRQAPNRTLTEALMRDAHRLAAFARRIAA